MAMNEAATSKLELPGFRFHPTEEELLDFYLKNTIFGKRLNYDVIGVLNIYRHDPWYLPGLAKIGEREWYFFVPRDTKHGSGGRPNRTTEHGFWKATGSDRKIFSLSGTKRCIGLRKTLVFYKGRAPNGTRTDWVMNEYRLPDSRPSHKDMVLCKIYRKATSLKVLEQRAAMEEEVRTISSTPPPSPSPLTPPISMDTVSFCSQPEDFVAGSNSLLKKEDEEAMPTISEEIFHNDETGEIKSPLSLQLPTGMEKLELQLPKFNKDLNSHDPFLTPLCSPWLDNWLIPYVLNL